MAYIHENEDDGILRIPVEIKDGVIHVPSFTLPSTVIDDDDGILDAVFIDDNVLNAEYLTDDLA